MARGTRIPKAVDKRIRDGLKRHQPILEAARDRDINESDTVVILTDFVHEVLGFAKYREITTEFSIRGTYCDLAVRLGGSVRYLLEAKAVGVTLKERHLRQAINYAAHHGIEWVVLSNGGHWMVYRMRFEQPIGYDKVFSVDLLSKPRKDAELVELLFLISREGVEKSAIESYQEEQAACNPFLIGAVVLSDPVLSVLRRELRRISPSAKIEADTLRDILVEDVLKRDIVDSDEARLAGKQARRASSRSLRAVRKVAVVSQAEARRITAPGTGEQPIEAVGGTDAASSPRS